MLKTSSATKTYHKNITTDILSLLNPANPHGVSSNMMSHADVSCRFHFYMFCIRTFDASDESSREVSSADMDSRHLYHGYAREILVRGMADSSRSIRAKIKTFGTGALGGASLLSSRPERYWDIIDSDRLSVDAFANFCFQATTTSRRTALQMRLAVGPKMVLILLELTVPAVLRHQ